ncbi:MAG TPA: FMN-binding negative transcriptional regulator [Usitatibacter sp.]|nr:FMN-binding negative transcriptional regulator [Usitatibacter sp.]
MTLYMPDHFRNDDAEDQFRLMQQYAFATLATASGDGELHLSHIPFVAERDAGGRIRLLGHVARANPHWQALEAARESVAIFQGPHAYVSPGWYQNHPAVPTWNYAVVHAHGRARLMDEAELHQLLMTLSSTYEAPRPNPWRMGDLPAAYVDSMLKMIVGFEIEVGRVEGKFKLSQNRPAEAPRVIAALEAEGEPELAALMRDHAPRKG